MSDDDFDCEEDWFGFELEEDDQDRIGCLFPDRCVAQGLHFISDCHDVEMIEQQEEAMRCQDP